MPWLLKTNDLGEGPLLGWDPLEAKGDYARKNEEAG
jgi:hypothetical protein